MAEIKRPFQVFNGTDWDTCFFDTDESLINTGFNQNIGSSGYKKMPGGLILQWAATEVPRTPNTIRVSWPLKFPNDIFGFTLGMMTDGAVGTNIITANVWTTGITLSQDWTSNNVKIYIFAIGN